MKKEMLNQYLKVLNIKEDIKTLEDINKVIKAHISVFPFSSVKVLLKEDISLDLEDIFKSIVLENRGGYCFEQNKLFYEVLKALGFDVSFYLSRVINNSDTMVPLTHRITVLNYEDEKYLIDVGIGFRTACIAIKFSEQEQYSHLGISYSIKKEEDSYFMTLEEDKKSFRATRFTLNKCYEIDFDLGHFYSHKHKNAAFVNNLVVSLQKQNCLFSLVNKKYIKKYENKIEEFTINTYKEFKDILLKDLNLNLEEKELKDLYDRFILV